MGRQSLVHGAGSFGGPGQSPAATSSTAHSLRPEAGWSSQTGNALLNSGRLQLQSGTRRNSRLSVRRRSSLAYEHPHTHWLRYEHHDIVNAKDVELMPATDIAAVKRRVEMEGYSGFCVRDNVAHIKKVTKQLQISDLDRVEPSRSAVFYIYCIDASDLTNATSFQAFSQDSFLKTSESLRERLGSTRQLSSRQRADGFERLDLLGKQIPERVEAGSRSSAGFDDGSSFGDDPFAGDGNAAAEAQRGSIAVQRGGRRHSERRESTQSHRETRILAQNFLKDFLATTAGGSTGSSSDSNDNSQTGGQKADGSGARRRRRSFHLDLYGPPTAYKGSKQGAVSPPMALQRDTYFSNQDVSRAVVSARELLHDEVGKMRLSSPSGMRSTFTEMPTTADQPQAPVRGLDSLLRTSLRCALQGRGRKRMMDRFSVMYEEF